jgi:hypothetical protein
VKARPRRIREVVLEERRRGVSFSVLARDFGLPIGTVKTWCCRSRMKPGAAQEAVRDMKPEGPAVYRGVTALDLPGKDRFEQSLNFYGLKRGTYPPRSAGIPGTLVGEELLAALRVWCAKRGRRGE